MIEKAIYGNTVLKKVLILLISAMFLLAYISPVIYAADDTLYLLEAEKLKSLGLFKGTDIGYELERVPNRAEAGVMLVRLLGKESEALMQDYPHTFADVPEWVDRFVGYMWEYGLTKGVGGNNYAPYEPVDARSYLTFILRSLGYSDDEGDFSWEQALDFSLDIGLISGREYNVLTEEVFTRGHMAAVSYNAMNCRLKDSEITLAASLAKAGAIDEATAVSENFLFNIPDWKRYLRYLEAGYFKPYVVGKDVDTALIELRKAGAIDIGIVYSYNELVPVDHVISQDFPAYMDSGESFECTIEVSIGPSLLNQPQLQELVEDKEWSDDVAPYIIAAAKFLIKETVLTRYDVLKRLEENINKVVLVDEETSAKMSFGAVYDSHTGNLYINKFIMDEELILHEITHAMSYSPDSGKLGFPVTGINTRAITEAFTYYTSNKINGPSTGILNEFYTGTEDIVFSGGEYSAEGRSNFILGVFAPLFTLADRQSVEKMYFLDVSKFSKEVLDFNLTYGEQRWETLWSQADKFVSNPPFLSFEERNEMALLYSNYLDGIIECLFVDLENAVGSENKLIVLNNKIESIMMQFPLNYRDYRSRLTNLKNEVLKELSNFREVKPPENPGTWTVPDFSGKEALEVYNILSLLGAADDIGYRIIESEQTGEPAITVYYVEPNSSDEEPVQISRGDVLNLGGVYIIGIPGFLNGYEGYLEMRDIIEDFGMYLADFSNLKSYIVGRALEAEGFSYKYDFIYFDDVSPQMNGRIVGQFPEPGTAVIPGKTTIIIRLVRKRPDLVR